MQYFEMLRQHYGITKKSLCKATGLTLSKYNTIIKGGGTINNFIVLADFYNLNSVEFSIALPGSNVIEKIFDLFHNVDTPVSVIRELETLEEGKALREKRKKAILNKLSLADNRN